MPWFPCAEFFAFVLPQTCRPPMHQAKPSCCHHILLMAGVYFPGVTPQGQRTFCFFMHVLKNRGQKEL